jgi:hypothetical protein
MQQLSTAVLIFSKAAAKCGREFKIKLASRLDSVIYKDMRIRFPAQSCCKVGKASDRALAPVHFICDPWESHPGPQSIGKPQGKKKKSVRRNVKRELLKNSRTPFLGLTDGTDFLGA